MGEILVARDLPDFDEEVQVLARIYDTVWVAVEEKLEDGSVVVNRVTGEPLEGKSRFEQYMSVAGGMFVIAGDEPILEVREKHW